MHSEEDLLILANVLLKSLHLGATSCEVLQPLWADYGSISRLTIAPKSSFSRSKDSSSPPGSLILKSISPPPVQGSIPSESHLRKLISYEVEQYFYTTLAPLLPESIPVARCIASSSSSDPAPGSSAIPDRNITTILTDLQESFPIAAEEQRSALSTTEVHAALDWLATFHGFWWSRNFELRSSARLRLPPLEERLSKPGNAKGGVWLNGGYTYLATRRSEYAALESSGYSPWREPLCSPIPDAPSQTSLAELVAIILAPSPSSQNSTTPTSQYETLLHGDVKSANLFTTTEPSSSQSVAFFDFQYVGLGLGVCDLAKLFTCSVPMSMLLGKDKKGWRGRENVKLGMGAGERELLERYRRTIEEVSGKLYSWDELERHWNCALVDWLRFQAGWGFWGNTQWLEARVRYIVADEEWREWVYRTAARVMEANARS